MAVFVNDTNTIALWRMNGDASDETGNHHGTLVGSPPFIACIDEQAVELNGSSQRIDCGTGYTLGGEYTVDFLVRREDVHDETQAVYAINSASYDNRFMFFFLSSGIGDIRLYYNSSSPEHSIPIIAGQWHYISVVHSVTNDKTQVYVDGSLEVDTGGAINVNPSDILTIGSEIDAGPSYGNYFLGSIGELRISDIRRTPAEEWAGILKADEGIFERDGKTVALWRLNGDLIDETGNYDGLVNSGAAAIDGVVDQAYEFSGSEQITFPTTLNTRPLYCYEAILKIPQGCEPGDPLNIIGTVHDKVGAAVGFGSFTGQVEDETLWIFDDPPLRSRYASVPIPGTWIYLAINRNGFSYDFYLNGVLLSSDFSGINLPLSDIRFSLGRRADFAQFFQGIADEQRFSDSARTAQEIADLYSKMQELLEEEEEEEEEEEGGDDLKLSDGVTSFGLQNEHVITEVENSDNMADSVDILHSRIARDGVIYDDRKWTSKTITIKGHIQEDSALALTNKIRLLKALIQGKDGDLKQKKLKLYVRGLGEDSYKVYNEGVVLGGPALFAREHYNVRDVPFSFKFLSSFPYSEELGETRTEFLSQASLSSNYSVTNGGDIETYGVIRLSINTATGITAVTITNNTMNSRNEITLSEAFASGDLVSINNEAENVTNNDSYIDYVGFFIPLMQGVNDVQVEWTGTAIDYDIEFLFKKRYP